MRFSSLLLALLFCITLHAQDAINSSVDIVTGSSNRSDTISGTIRVNAINDQATIKVEEVDNYISFPVVEATSNVISLAWYSQMAGAYDERYRAATEFKVDITSADSVQSFSSLTPYTTPEMETALGTIKKNGGTATFKFIKTLRGEQKVSLPSFKYVTR